MANRISCLFTWSRNSCLKHYRAMRRSEKDIDQRQKPLMGGMMPASDPSFAAEPTHILCLDSVSCLYLGPLGHHYVLLSDPPVIYHNILNESKQTFVNEQTIVNDSKQTQTFGTK